MPISRDAYPQLYYVIDHYSVPTLLCSFSLRRKL